jgi:outer membrane receptor protein involved in Fe transport
MYGARAIAFARCAHAGHGRSRRPRAIAVAVSGIGGGRKCYALLALRLEWKPQRRGGWRTFLRVDNLFDREYVSSVIVNEGNGRYFEPGAGRSVTLGLGYGR